MNAIENCLLLAGLPLGMILVGYWLAAGLREATASERLATAILAGLALLLWGVATVNFFKPLNTLWAWVCLSPALLTAFVPTYRRLLRNDFATVLMNRRGVIAALLGAAFMLVLLWPLLTRPSLVFYDGTSNHDAFFWISGAEHLKRHTYMAMPITGPLHPLTNATPAIIGLKPVWGRMGAEGLLALTSSAVGLAPVKLYLVATASLLVPWIAAVFLAVRTFLVGRLGIAATLALVVLQPVFVFFHGNANLPNLVGALSGAAAVIATEQSLRGGQGRWAWLVLVALGFHGLICTYPEMLPFVIMPAGLLWLRAWFRTSPRLIWKGAGLSALAWIAGASINPASTMRAYFGFVSSYDTARANQNWANLFDPLSLAEYVPALATLAVGASKSLGPVLGTVLTVALLLGVVLAFRRASDRLGTLFTLAGAGVLMGYTLYTGFNYGWQKTVQFGGVFWAALLPVAVIDAYARTGTVDKRVGYFTRAALVVVVALFGYATVLNCLDGHKWSQRKILTQDWFEMREYARTHLNGAPVLVDGASFRMAFFHGMWASYFLAESEIYFAARGDESGGYLRHNVINEANGPIPAPAGTLVSRNWADAFDANSERHIVGDTVALMKNANRVTHWEGLHPNNGVPENAEAQIVLELRPHSRSQLKFELTPRYTGQGATERWQVTCRTEGKVSFAAEVDGPPPWKITVPLTPGQSNRIELNATPTPPKTTLPPFGVQKVSIETVLE